MNSRSKPIVKRLEFSDRWVAAIRPTNFPRRFSVSTRQRPQTHQQSSQILHGRKQHQLADYACQISRPEPNRTCLARAKAFHMEHCEAPHQGRTCEQNRTVLAGKTRRGKMFQIHRTFAECSADSCRPPRKRFRQIVAKSLKTALTSYNKSQWPT